MGSQAGPGRASRSPGAAARKVLPGGTPGTADTRIPRAVGRVVALAARRGGRWGTAPAVGPVAALVPTPGGRWDTAGSRVGVGVARGAWTRRAGPRWPRVGRSRVRRRSERK